MDERLPLDEVIAAALAVVPAERQALFRDFARAVLHGLDRPDGGVQGLAHLLTDLFELALTRRPGEILVRVGSPPDRPGRSVIEIVQDDRPFIVDTVRLVLRRLGFRERLFLHPIVGARRDAEGELRLVDANAKAPPESVVCVEVVPRLAESEQIAEIEAELRDVMGTARDVTEDHARVVREVRKLGANIELAASRLTGGPDRAAKICRFLDWLVQGRFIFMGYRRYGLHLLPDRPGDYEAWLVRGSGLGLWRDDSTSRLLEPKRGTEIPEEVREFVEDPRIIVIDKSHVEAPIYRQGRLDRIVVMELDEDGRQVGFGIVFGLFTSHALRTPGSQVPLLTERLEQILRDEGVPHESHRHRALFAAFDTMPIEVLLGTDVEGVATLIREIVRAEGQKAARLVLRAHPRARSFYAAVVQPRERYAEELRVRLRELIEAETGASYVDDRATFVEEGTAILHFFCTASGPVKIPDPGALEREVQELCASWEDRFNDALIARFGESEGARLAARYEAAFPEALRDRTEAADALRDVEALEALGETGQPQFALYFARGDRARETAILRIYLPSAPLLSDLLPVVDHFGVGVVDAQQATLQPRDRAPVVVETLRVLPLGGSPEDLEVVAPRLGEALRAVLTGAMPDDTLNGLVLGAGLEWRQVDCLRAYLDYFMQVQGTLALGYLRGVLLQNPLAVRLLVRLHEARLDSSLDESERETRESWARQAFEGYRDRISALNEDRALAGLCGLIDATLRTSFFASAREPHRIAFKVDPARVPGLVGPQPHREIFVHSTRMKGIHLRGGPVARGGLRFSDRADDLRVEILDLMRTQMLKNGLIVPVGAKGGFVLKQGGLSPRETRALADEQYRVFVASLLDLTDNLTPDGRVAPPAGVHRRDGDDPYLVVAADKGTAHLSDAANQVAAERDFWLGDAFASGGSEGYDHKRYGITARGAWECVRHHFAELGIDPERDDYSVAGIGDMSGDVFGNGLLLMRRARLIAAFDHRHVFLDPDPDPEAAWTERKRLFELAGSTWADYDAARISAGGGVYPRTAKRIDLPASLRERLGLRAGEVSGNDVVRAILALDVDLLWNGGIGTYVKAAGESHAEVGDRANDAVRIDAGELRARAIGEGGNLGLTQAARIEAALAGVRLDTDAIDNSAGVDLSDHEVNYKILLAPAVRGGTLAAAERRSLLFEVAEDACERVLAHNRGQALALSLDELRSRHDMEPFRRTIEHLCAPADVDRDELGLPDARTLTRRAAKQQGLTRPELAVLLGLAKLETRRALAASERIQADLLEPLFRSYFAVHLREAHAAGLGGHRLRAEITALVITNRVVDAGGSNLVPSLCAELGADVPDVALAVLLAEEILGIPGYRERLIGLPPPVARSAVQRGLIELDRGARRVARYLIKSGIDRQFDAESLERLRQGVDELRSRLPDFLSANESAQVEVRRADFEELGLPGDLAADLAMLPLADRGLNILRLCTEVPVAPLEAARVYSHLGDATAINWLYQRLVDARPADLWDRMVLVNLRWELLDLQRELTQRLLVDGPPDPMAAARIFVDEHASLLTQVRELEQRAHGTETPSALLVVAQRLRDLRRTTPGS